MYANKFRETAVYRRTAQKPDTFRFGSLREHLHTLALAGVDIIFLSLLEPD